MVRIERNTGRDFDVSLIGPNALNLPGIQKRAAEIGTRRTVKKDWQAAWLLRAVTCIDLTTLAGDDTFTNVERLCHKAKRPIRTDLLEALGMDGHGITVGAVCVYPSRVGDAVKALAAVNASDIPVASVATGFPAGQTMTDLKLKEIEYAVKSGATEIDIVISREFVLGGEWKKMYDEVRAMRESCGDAHLKAIIAVGELGSYANVYRASMVCMMAGADFIKTSTGKEGVNANLPVGLIMVRAIRDYHQLTGFKVGFKPAGGIRSAKDACTWLALMKEELGNEWLNNSLFRMGASSLLTDIERQIFHHVYGRYANAEELALA